MRKFFISAALLLVLFGVFLYVYEKKHQPSLNVQITPELIASGIKVIDIRTNEEWKETGIIPGSYPVTFFDDSGSYNIYEFRDKLNMIVHKNERFGLICRSGNRSAKAAKILYDDGYKNVINIDGGIEAAQKLKMKLTPFSE